LFGGWSLPLAARNNWIEDIKANKSRIAIYLWGSCLSSCVWYCLVFLPLDTKGSASSYISFALIAFGLGIQSIPIGLAIAQSSSWILSVPNTSLLISFPSL
jgi:hypothetical protein